MPNRNGKVRNMNGRWKSGKVEGKEEGKGKGVPFLKLTVDDPVDFDKTIWFNMFTIHAAVHIPICCKPRVWKVTGQADGQ